MRSRLVTVARIPGWKVRARWQRGWRSKPHPYWYTRRYSDTGSNRGTIQSGPVEVYLYRTR